MKKTTKFSRSEFLKCSAALLGGVAGSALLNACGLSGEGTIGAPAHTATLPAGPTASASALRGMVVFPNDRRMKSGSFLPANSPTQAWFSLQDLRRMKEKGATCVEIHQIWLPDLMPEQDVPNEVYLAQWVDVWVDWCSRSGLDCILNVTGLGAFADWAFYTSMPAWLWDSLYPAPEWKDKAACDAIIRDFFDLDVAKQDQNRAAFIDLWKTIASRYKDAPQVSFSLMNEPFWLVDIPDEPTAIRLGQSYSAFMEEIVDGIRASGADQKVFIDLPFLWKEDGQCAVQPVEREGIVWEAHMYGNIWEPDNRTFKQTVDGFVRLFVEGFKKPLFIGEYGFNPISSIHTKNGSDWQAMLKDMVAYMDGLPLLGRQFVAWDYLSGELENFSAVSDLTAEDSEWIMDTVLAGKK
jgi:hypothetical protein